MRDEREVGSWEWEENDELKITNYESFAAIFGLKFLCALCVCFDFAQHIALRPLRLNRIRGRTRERGSQRQTAKSR